MNSCEITLITAWLKGKAVEQQKGKRVQVPGMKEFLVDYVSKGSVVASPHAEEVGIGAGEETTTSPHPGEVGSDPTLEVVAIIGVREEEEEE